MFLFAVAQALEARTLERARDAVRALMDLTPAEALRARRRQASAGSPSSRSRRARSSSSSRARRSRSTARSWPAHSAVNQAPVTGESLPVDKAPGDEVFAGTINGRGALEVRVTRLRRDTTLARIIHLVEQAQAQRAPVADVRRAVRARLHAGGHRAGRRASPSCRRWPSARRGTTWIYRALVLLVVSCPCALVISTPVSIVAALAGAARKGVLIKGGAHLERAGRVRCVAFDKTGTLTRGMPEVVDVVALNGESPRRDRRAGGRGRAALRASDRAGDRRVRRGSGASACRRRRRASSLPGRGAEGRVDGARVVLGNHRLFEERGSVLAGDSRAARRVERARAHAGARRARRRGRRASSPSPTGRANRRATPSICCGGRASSRIVMLTGDSHGTATRDRGASSASTTSAPSCMPEDKVAADRRAAARGSDRSRWSATASTTRPRWRRPTSASRWAPPAATPRSRPPTSR